jgi:hypothetical protein
MNRAALVSFQLRLPPIIQIPNCECVRKRGRTVFVGSEKELCLPLPVSALNHVESERCAGRHFTTSRRGRSADVIALAASMQDMLTTNQKVSSGHIAGPCQNQGHFGAEMLRIACFWGYTWNHFPMPIQKVTKCPACHGRGRWTEWQALHALQRNWGNHSSHKAAEGFRCWTGF